MQLKQYREVSATHFDNDKAKGIDARVVIGKNDGGNNFYMRVFEIAPGGHTPMHTHDWEHEMFIHAGEGEVFGNNCWNPIKPGKAVLVQVGADVQGDEVRLRIYGVELLDDVAARNQRGLVVTVQPDVSVEQIAKRLANGGNGKAARANTPWSDATGWQL